MSSPKLAPMRVHQSPHLHRRGAPVAQEVRRVLPRPHRAAHLIALIQRLPDHLHRALAVGNASQGTRLL